MWGQHDEAVMEVCGGDQKMYGWLTEEKKTEGDCNGR